MRKVSVRAGPAAAGAEAEFRFEVVDDMQDQFRLSYARDHAGYPARRGAPTLYQTPYLKAAQIAPVAANRPCRRPKPKVAKH